MIDGCLIIINQYYNTPTELPGKKEGQFAQAPGQIILHSCLVTDRFKISPFPDL